MIERKIITLIGMSGVGKSTIGKAVAKELDFDFIDPDRMMEKDAGKSIQGVLDDLGDEAFMDAEHKKVKEVFEDYSHGSDSENEDEINNGMVFASGGSVIYREDTMKIIKDNSIVVYLDRNIDKLLAQTDPENRGIVGLDDKTFRELFLERQDLYEKYADKIITLDNQSISSATQKVVEIMKVPC
jgi:shikimate kinase